MVTLASPVDPVVPAFMDTVCAWLPADDDVMWPVPDTAKESPLPEAICLIKPMAWVCAPAEARVPETAGTECVCDGMDPTVVPPSVAPAPSFASALDTGYEEPPETCTCPSVSSTHVPVKAVLGSTEALDVS